MILFQADIIEQKILNKISAFQRAGGKIIVTGNFAIKNVEGEVWRGSSKLMHIAPLTQKQTWPRALASLLSDDKGVDGKLDGVWTRRRGKQLFVFNSADQPVATTIDGELAQIAPYSIWFNQPFDLPQ